MTEPKYLYRYQRLPDKDKSNEKDWLENLFTHNKLWFSSPSSFNDPFDCKIAFTFNGTFEECTELIKFAPDEEKDYLKDCFAQKHQYNQRWRVGFIKEYKKIFNEASEKVGIHCLSEVNDDILMWSHYSKAHKGFCLEFETKIIKDWKNVCEPINYSDSFPNIIEMLPDRTYKILFWKSKHWMYEKEWRVIFANRDLPTYFFGNRNYDFPPEMLTGVIFGCAMDDKDKNAIRELLKLRENQTPITFYQAKKKDSEFGLDIKKTEWKPDEGWVILPE